MPILVPTSPRDATSRAPGPDFSSKPHSAAEAFFASPELVEHLFDELDHESHRVLAYMRMQFLDAFARRRYRKIDLMMMEKLLKVADTTRKQLYLSAVRELDLMSWYHPSKTLASLIKPVIQHTAAANLPVDLIFDHFDLGAGSRAGTMPGVDHNGRSNMGVSIPYFVRHVRTMLPRIEIIDLIGAQVWLPLEIQGPRYGNDYMADEIGLVTYRISDIRLNEPDERLEGVISIRYNEDLPVGYVVSDAADATTLAPKSPYLPEFLPKPEGFKIVRRVTFTAYNEEAFLMPFLQLSDEALARSVPWWPMVDEIHFRPAAQSSEHPAWSRQVSPLALLDRMLEWRSTRPPSCLTVSYMEVPSTDSILRVLRHPILRNLASLQVILGYDDRWDQGTPDITDIMQAVSDNLPVLEQLNIQASVPSEVHSRPGLTEPLSRLRRISVLTRNTELNPFNLAIYLSRCTTLATEIHIAQPSSFIPYPYEQHVADLGRAFSFDPQALYTTDLSTIGIRCPATLTAFCNLSIDERSVELEVNRSSFSNLERPCIQPAA